MSAELQAKIADLMMQISVMSGGMLELNDAIFQTIETLQTSIATLRDMK
jgi:hypothetical protein